MVLRLQKVAAITTRTAPVLAPGLARCPLRRGGRASAGRAGSTEEVVLRRRVSPRKRGAKGRGEVNSGRRKAVRANSGRASPALIVTALLLLVGRKRATVPLDFSETITTGLSGRRKIAISGLSGRGRRGPTLV